MPPSASEPWAKKLSKGILHEGFFYLCSAPLAVFIPSPSVWLMWYSESTQLSFWRHKRLKDPCDQPKLFSIPVLPSTGENQQPSTPTASGMASVFSFYSLLSQISPPAQSFLQSKLTPCSILFFTSDEVSKGFWGTAKYGRKRYVFKDVPHPFSPGQFMGY